jgi:hypothetical protein
MVTVVPPAIDPVLGVTLVTVGVSQLAWPLTGMLCVAFVVFRLLSVSTIDPLKLPPVNGAKLMG